MEFLNQLAYPQSMEHFRLLVFMLGVVSFVYLPYLAYLTGCFGLSYVFARAAGGRAASPYQELSALLISAALIDGKLIVFLGLVPSLSLLFLVSQLLQATPAIAVALLAAAAVALAAAAAVLYAYRFSFRLSRLLSSVERQLGSGKQAAELDRTIADQRRRHQRRSARFGLAGAVLMMISLFLTEGALAIAADPGSWTRVESVFGLLLMPSAWIRFLQFLTLAPAVCGVALLFFVAYGKAGFGTAEESIRTAAQQWGIRLAAVGLLAQPIFVVAGMAAAPANALAGLSFGLAGAGLAAFFAALHAVYGAHKEGVRKHAAGAFAAVVIGLGLLVMQDQATIAAATRPHAARLALEYDKATEEFKARLGISLSTVSGEDIYNGKCSACHLPDARKVGPPFKLAVEKYRGRKDALVSFIRNPVKVDPDYPPMPNQGLKPAEVDSIATYLIRKYLNAAPPSS